MARAHIALLRWFVSTLLLAALVSLSATTASAGSSHATFSFAAPPPALTLSDSTTTRNGLLQGVLNTQNTTTTHVLLTVTVKATQVLQFVATGSDNRCTRSSRPDPGTNLIVTTFACQAPNLHPRSTEVIPINSSRR